MPRTEDDEAPSVPALPDLRTEQFFLSLARKDVHIPEVAVEEMHKHTHTNNATPWDKATGVSTLPMVYSVLMDQFFSPLWQGVLWGLGGVALAHARQMYTIAKASRMRSPAARAITIGKGAEETAPMHSWFSNWVAWLGLSRLLL